MGIERGGYVPEIIIFPKVFHEKLIKIITNSLRDLFHAIELEKRVRPAFCLSKSAIRNPIWWPKYVLPQKYVCGEDMFFIGAKLYRFDRFLKSYGKFIPTIGCASKNRLGNVGMVSSKEFTGGEFLPKQ